jgi:hypothetical protein
LIRQTTPYATRKGAIVALATACVLALQMLFAGVAMSEAAAGGVRSGFSVTCATQGKIAPDSSPVAPSKHAHGLCCILHQGALPESDLRDDVGIELARAVEVSSPPPHYCRDALRAAPELAPLSPRAPPLPSL